jgi:hypothetical protein
MNKRIKEQGEAQITLKLKDSKITMYHGTYRAKDLGSQSLVVLNEWSAHDGDWHKMFTNIRETFSKKDLIRRLGS